MYPSKTVACQQKRVPMSVIDVQIIPVAGRNDDVAALKNNLSGQKHVKVTRHIHGRHANEYVYCGLYAVCYCFAGSECSSTNCSNPSFLSQMCMVKSYCSTRMSSVPVSHNATTLA